MPQVTRPLFVGQVQSQGRIQGGPDVQGHAAVGVGTDRPVPHVAAERRVAVPGRYVFVAGFGAELAKVLGHGPHGGEEIVGQGIPAGEDGERLVAEVGTGVAVGVEYYVRVVRTGHDVVDNAVEVDASAVGFAGP